MVTSGGQTAAGGYGVVGSPHLIFFERRGFPAPSPVFTPCAESLRRGYPACRDVEKSSILILSRLRDPADEGDDAGHDLVELEVFGGVDGGDAEGF